MPTARHTQVSLEETPFYHCISRCVRRAFLCGHDPVSQQSYEHRREWVRDRLLELPQYFAIQVCAYAVLSNHTHVVLQVQPEVAQAWSLDEVIERWHGLFSGTSVSQRYLAGQPLLEAEFKQLTEQVALWRERLTSVSWFMRCLNETIARRANAEDHCTGRFWEGRFKCQALLDEAALAACLAYVDLNPIRAGMASTPEDSDFTSIQERIHTLSNANDEADPTQPPTLVPFVGYPRKDMPDGLPFRLTDYLDLVEWTGRILRDDKHGPIDPDLPDLLTRLHISPNAWHTLAEQFEKQFSHSAGAPIHMEAAARRRHQNWLCGTGNARRLFNSA